MGHPFVKSYLLTVAKSYITKIPCIKTDKSNAKLSMEDMCITKLHVIKRIIKTLIYIRKISGRHFISKVKYDGHYALYFYW